MEIELKKFRQMLEKDQPFPQFDEAVRMGLFPIKENGKVDFSNGWEGIADFMEGLTDEEIKAAMAADSNRQTIREKIRQGVGGSQWEEEGFLSEEGYRAFCRAEANNRVHIFSKRRDA